MREDKTPSKPWTVIHVTLILFVRDDNTQEPLLLIGDKVNGSVAGWTMPPGGHVDPTDKDVISAAEREGLEEVGLSAEKGKSRKVAEITVSIEKEHEKVIVHVVKCTSWTGDVKVNDPHFTNVRFQSIHQLPHQQMPTGEDPWMRAVLAEKLYCRVYIICRENRRDVTSVTTSRYERSPF